MRRNGSAPAVSRLDRHSACQCCRVGEVDLFIADEQGCETVVDGDGTLLVLRHDQLAASFSRRLDAVFEDAGIRVIHSAIGAGPALVASPSQGRGPTGCCRTSPARWHLAQVDGAVSLVRFVSGFLG